MKVPIIRDDFWTKFINRRGTPVNLLDTEDVDGEARTPVDKITLPLPSQVIDQKYIRETDYNTSEDNVDFIPGSGTIMTEGQTYYMLFHNVFVSVDEIKERFDYGNIVTENNPTEDLLYYFKVQYSGTYTINCSIRYLVTLIAVSPFFDIIWYFQVKSKGSLQMPVQIGSPRSGQYNPATGIKDLNDHNLVDHIINLKAGDEIYIFAEFTLTGSGGGVSNYYSDYNNAIIGFDPIYTEFSITANTTYPQTSTDAFLLKDAFESVISKITGRDSVIVSDYFATCKRLYAVMLGLHVRGYPMDEKIFSRSFNDLWEGADPCFNLGLAYEGEQIRIEEKSYFYNKEPIVNLSNLFGITRIYDQNYFIKSFEAGFQTWSLESESGIDDQQTKRIYRSKLKSLGKDFKNLSGFLAASLAIEQTRRNRIEEGKDWRGDEEIMIIALKAIEGGYTPELGSDFTTITNLLNSDSRYNVRLGVGFLIDRWMDWLSGSLALFPDKYYFASGEGNYITEVTKPVSDCDGSGSIVENQDFQVSSENFIKLPHRYQYTHPMSYDIYKIIRDNRHNALGLSRSDAFYTPHHIHKMEYLIVEGRAEFVVDLAVIPTEENGFRYLEDDNFVIFGTEGLLFQDLEEILYQDGETALVGLDT
jgi:hypothetical protein